MQNQQFEKILGININDYEIGNNKPNLDLLSNTYSMIFPDKHLSYFNNSTGTIFFNVLDDNTINEVKIKLDSLIDEKFFNEFLNEYGKAKNILIVDSIQRVEKGFAKENTATYKKTEGKLKEGSFNEKPIFIIWEKQSFKIEILMKYQQNISEIRFKNVEK